ncbi:bis(5'-nucleosyl)-tetraphosphatase (symmetrical) YqeK [Ligilactobacillus sp. Marseille-Q7487]|jgi:predicted HD superfamily hydrolase involved in NAD metabolism|uniref:bis(5'-nucleosyl)-tetraphosphatase (symmetrical) YqeK n=1 Tax=Ligilactobacillus sp. Marseille-Q7487 TaxID=3022128 RepID=UPI0015B4BE80|nr:bis(5'-nucleosyl)-tetraphosphatase (symmetrical) YqeK [Ligilactobacillus sp. Marseille-Q7487]
MKELSYPNKYYSGTRQQLLEIVQQAMSPKRFKHVCGVEKAAVKLAKANGCELEKASVAALVHDYAKERSDQDFINCIKEHNMDEDLLSWNNNIWHGVVGAKMIAQELKITDAEILSAVEKHTVGAAQMTTLEQILYVADYIEENRDFPGVAEARELAASDLQAAVRYETYHTLKHLIETKKTIYPAAIVTYNHWVAK